MSLWSKLPVWLPKWAILICLTVFGLVIASKVGNLGKLRAWLDDIARKLGHTEPSGLRFASRGE